MKALTDKKVQGLKPREASYSVRDSGKDQGLEIRVNSDGSKSWSLRYKHGKTRRRIKLGQYPA